MTLQEKSTESVKNQSTNVREWLARQNSSQSQEPMSPGNLTSGSKLRLERVPSLDRKIGVANISRLPAVSPSALYELAQSTRQARLRFEQQYQENPPPPRATSAFSSPDAAVVDISNPFDRRPRQDDGGRAEMLRAAFAARRAAQSETSFTSQTSSDSRAPIDDLLGLRESDPEEVLLSLGFGGPFNSPSRIPPRFLGPSSVRGVDIQAFLGREQERLETVESGAFGYRGLQGPPHRRPSQIVANIIDRIKEQERLRKQMALVQQNGWGLVTRRLNSSSHWSSYEENDKPIVRNRPSPVAEDPGIPFPGTDVNANIPETQESSQKLDISNQSKDTPFLIPKDNVTEDPVALCNQAPPTSHEVPLAVDDIQPVNLPMCTQSECPPLSIDTTIVNDTLQGKNSIAPPPESKTLPSALTTLLNSQESTSQVSSIDGNTHSTCVTPVSCGTRLTTPTSLPVLVPGASFVKDNVDERDGIMSDEEGSEDCATGFAAFVKSYDEGGAWDDEEVESFSKVILREDWTGHVQHPPLREDKGVGTDFSYMDSRACESALIWLLSHALKMYRKGRSTRVSNNKTLNVMREQAATALEQAEVTLAALKDLPPTGSSDNLQKCLQEVLLLLEEQETLQEKLVKEEEEEIEEEERCEGKNLDPLWLQTLEKRLSRQIRVSVRKSVYSALRRQRRRKLHSARRVTSAPKRQVASSSTQNEESDSEGFEEISTVPVIVPEPPTSESSKPPVQEINRVPDENAEKASHILFFSHGEPHSFTVHSSCETSQTGLSTSASPSKSKSRWVNRARVVGKFSRWLKTVTENSKSNSQERRFQF